MRFQEQPKSITKGYWLILGDAQSYNRGQERNENYGKKVMWMKCEVQGVVGWAFWPIVPDSALIYFSFGGPQIHKGCAFHLIKHPEVTHRWLPMWRMASNYNQAGLQDYTSLKRNNILDKAKGRKDWAILEDLAFSLTRNCVSIHGRLLIAIANEEGKKKTESHISPLYLEEHNANALLIWIELSEIKSSFFFMGDCGR